MTAERYRQINQLADALLELPADRHVAFLAGACSGDAELLEQVKRLVDAQLSAEDFLAVPAIERLAPEFVGTDSQLVGRRIGRYEVLSKLGSGGHGQVWLCQDGQLSRRVAVKLLSPAYASRPEHVRRLYTEARISSALNHPNIVTIYDTGQAEDAHFIAQEYVAGETLRQFLENGPIHLQRALDVAMQIASALEAAHAAGIVHRDIKPENVMIRGDGLVKVLDFGLARFVEEDDHQPRAVSGPGLVMGTLRYMSPEQVRGAPADFRSDIFSFGVVLYESLCGQPPFRDGTPEEILTAILELEPEPVSRRVQGLPASFDRILRRCLAKVPEQRYSTVTELRQDLAGVSSQLNPEATASSRRWWLGAAATAVGLGSAFAAYRKLGASRSAPFGKMNISLLTAPGVVPDATISPDGRSVAYVLNEAHGQSLWIRGIDGSGDQKLLPAEQGSHRDVTFSPDARWIYYVRGTASWNGTLYRIATPGGAPIRILDNLTGRFAFSPDGQDLAFIRLDTEHWEESLIVAHCDGSAERKVATRRRPKYYSRSGLAWAPDGRSIVCLAGNAPFYTSDAFHLVEIDLADGTERTLTGPKWAWPGSLLWSADGHSMFVGAGEYSEDALQVWRVSYPDGTVQRITNDLSNYTRLTQSADSKTVLAVRWERIADLWRMPAGEARRAAQVSSGDLHQLNDATWASAERIVYTALAGDSRKIWRMDAHGGNRKQVTFEEFSQSEAAVTPDGRFIIYTSQGRIWRINSDGSARRRLTPGPLDVHPAVSPDGKWVIYAEFSGWSPGIGGRSMLWKTSIDGDKPVQLTRDINSMPDVSPDGRLIACSYSRDGALGAPPGIGVYPFEGGTAVKIFERPPGSDSHVYWAAHGTALDYIVTAAGVGNIWRQSMYGGPPAPITAFQADRIFFFSPSPDRNTLVLARGKEVNDLVLIKDIG